ncbi:MAG: hypothetical protein AB8G16_15020 [Gammaproteobacteria bacterium]
MTPNLIPRAAQLGALFAMLAMTVGCTTTQQYAQTDFAPPAGDYRMVVMPLDVTVSKLTAGGLTEPNAEWTNTARERLLQAIENQQQSKGGAVDLISPEACQDCNSPQMLDLVSLHNAVGQSILLHKVAGVTLPTKKNTFDWTLGDSAVEYGAASGYDYALFLFAENSFSTGGRKALQVAGLASCLIGVCAVVDGGSQLAFATLVDLNTGNVSWFNFLFSGLGDIRTAEGADDMIDRLLGSMYVSPKT